MCSSVYLRDEAASVRGETPAQQLVAQDADDGVGDRVDAIRLIGYARHAVADEAVRMLGRARDTTGSPASNASISTSATGSANMEWKKSAS